jgi:glycosyltransferase involved in cell wall biosynthesis
MASVSAGTSSAVVHHRSVKVCMFVRNACTHDARVLKEAKTLVAHGYDVTVIAVQLKQAPELEERDGFRIVRVPIDPVHYRILRWYRHLPTWRRTRARARLAYARRRKRIQRLSARTRLALRRRLRPPFVRLTARAKRAKRLAHKRILRRYGAFAPGPISARFRLRPRLRARRLLFAGSLRRHLTLHEQVVLPPARALAFGGGRALRTGTRLFGRVALGVASIPLHIARLLRAGIYSLLKFILFQPHGIFLLTDYTIRSARVARTLDAKVFHAHDLNTLFPALIAARRAGGRTVYDSHELSLEAGTSAQIGGLRRRALTIYERVMIRRADATITVNTSIAGELASRYGVQEPLVVMNCPPCRNGYPRDPILRRKAGLGPTDRVVLYQGGFGEGRGLLELVAAMAFVPDAVLVFLGEGVLRERLEAMARELSLEASVRFLPSVPQSELLAHSSSADVGVVPFQNSSLNNYLATPNKIFEYLMAGVPVVTSDFPEMARIVRENRVGSVFDPRKPEAIAAAIREVIFNPGHDDMRERAALVARTRYSWEIESQKLIGLYSKVATAEVQPTRRQPLVP